MRETFMDTQRWKSVLVPRDVYEDIKTMAQEEGRTISGQLRLIFETYVEKGFDKKHSYDPKKDPRRINVYD
jgi:predicted DNA-binding protein